MQVQPDRETLGTTSGQFIREGRDAVCALANQRVEQLYAGEGFEEVVQPFLREVGLMRGFAEFRADAVVASYGSPLLALEQWEVYREGVVGVGASDVDIVVVTAYQGLQIFDAAASKDRRWEVEVIEYAGLEFERGWLRLGTGPQREPGQICLLKTLWERCLHAFGGADGTEGVE